MAHPLKWARGRGTLVMQMIGKEGGKWKGQTCAFEFSKSPDGGGKVKQVKYLMERA